MSSRPNACLEAQLLLHVEDVLRNLTGLVGCGMKRKPDFGHSINDQIRLGNYGGPAPDTYYPQDQRNLTLGKVSDAVIPSYLDVPAKRNADIPGPGSYEVVGDVPLPEGGRFNEPPMPRHPDPREFAPEPATYDPQPDLKYSKLTKFTSTAPREA